MVGEMLIRSLVLLLFHQFCVTTDRDRRVTLTDAGNKLFQGRFIATIYNHPSLYDVLLWTLLNAGVGLVGKAASALKAFLPRLAHSACLAPLNEQVTMWQHSLLTSHGWAVGACKVSADLAASVVM